MHTTPTAAATPRRSSSALLAGLIDLTAAGRRPHPGAGRCGALCVPACTAASDAGPDDETLAHASGVRP